jgi:hypothetical protein
MSGERPILVAGKTGQLARCLGGASRRRGTPLVALGRPELDLTRPEPRRLAASDCVWGSRRLICAWSRDVLCRAKPSKGPIHICYVELFTYCREAALTALSVTSIEKLNDIFLKFSIFLTENTN